MKNADILHPLTTETVRAATSHASVSLPSLIMYGRHFVIIDDKKLERKMAVQSSVSVLQCKVA
jgi:hypothetical protein